MNYQINSKKINFNTTFILLISSILFIPFTYVFVAMIFISQILKGNINFKNISLTFKLIFVYILIGVIFSQYKLISTTYALEMLLCLYSYCLFFSSLNTLDFEKTKKILYILCLIVFLIGIIQYFNSDFAIPNKWVDAEEYNLNKRIYSTFYNPNIFGFFINVAIIIACEKFNFKKLNLEWVIFMLGVLCSYLTFSRTSWISLIVALSFAGIYDRKYFKFAIFFAISVFSMDFLMGVGRANISKAAKDSSFMYRLEIWKACIKIIRDNYLTGIGFGTLFKHITDYSNVVKSNVEHCHNLYLQVITETGVVGFSIFSVLLFNLAKKMFNKIKQGKNKKMWITAFSILIMTLIHGTVDSVFFTPQILMILSIYSGTLKTIDG